MPVNLSDMIPNASLEAIDLIEVVFVNRDAKSQCLLHEIRFKWVLMLISFLYQIATLLMGPIEEANC